MRDPFSIYESTFDRKKKIRSDIAWEEGIHGKNEDPNDFYEGNSKIPPMGLFISALLIIFVILGAQLVKLQITHGAYYQGLSNGNHMRVEEVLAPRGIIYDAQNQPLLQNVPSFELVVSPHDLPAGDVSSEVQSLAKTVNTDPKASFDPNALIKKLSTASRDSYQAISVTPNLSHDTALIFESQAQQYPGFSIENNPVRQYDDPYIFAHIIGYTGKINDSELAQYSGQGYLLNDYIGKAGLELSYEKYLKGTPGEERVEVDAAGNVQTTLGDVEPQPGNNLVLNIDGDLQRTIYNELVKNGNRKAAAVAMDPRTGQILALVSTPGFDNNLFSQKISQADYSALMNDPDQPMFNRAIAGLYPPGSTIKLVVASAGLQEGVITPDTKILDNGDLRVGSYQFHGWDLSGLGEMDVRSAIAESSDIYFYTVGGGQAKLGIQGLGPDRLAKYYELFGMGQKLGIDIPGEEAGLVGSPEERKARFSDPASQAWYLGDTYHESIGQGDMEVTPLQVAEWTAVVANGGTVYQPYIVNKVTDANGKTVLQNKPTAIRSNVVDPKYLEIVREGMLATVQSPSGTAKSLRTLPIEVAGKTGSAQFDDADPNSTHAWFTSFAPYNNPQIVVTVLIEKAGEGAPVAAPVVKATLAWWAANRYNK